MFFAFKALKNINLAPAANIYFQTVVEEECSGNGALAALHSGVKADAVVIPEPFPFLVTAQLGVLWLQVFVTGKPAHVLNTSAGVNAIDAAYGLYKSLVPLEEHFNSEQMRHPAFKNLVHPVNFNLGKIEGGDWASSVPAKAKLDLRIGLFPEMAISFVQKQIEDTFAEFAKKNYPNGNLSYRVEYSGFQAEGCEMLRKNPDGTEQIVGEEALFQTLKQSFAESSADPENKPEILTSAPITCTTDARFYLLYGHMPATCFGPESQNYHGIDESVGLDSLFRVTKTLALFIANWCKLEDIPPTI